jgi:NADH-quinone oxidoreductase subunit G
MKIPIKVNNILIQAPKNYTILQICENLNILIPRFCFHSKLSIAGNCRMCLVEVKNSPKPVVACAMPLSANMEIFTNTPLVKKTRENILEFLLINHPLDCPICDQGGECDLQDQTFFYGSDNSKFNLNKRSVQNKNCGPFIKTIMTRCIHCTRCVRFAQEITGNAELGTVGRGTQTEITTFINKILISELSGNVIDLCPVGALTSKPYAFKARSWELSKKTTIDCLDSLGSNIQVDLLNNKILRIVPKKNPFINDNWISDKTRFSFDSINSQRILTPLIKKNNNFVKISWEDSFKILEKKYKEVDSTQICNVFDNFIDLETSFLVKSFNNQLGIKNIYQNNKFEKDLNVDFNNKLLNLNLKNIRNTDLCLLVYCNVKEENTILNIHLKNNYNLYNTSVYNIGNKLNLNYPTKHIGNNLTTFLQILEGKHFLNFKLKKAKNPLIIFGAEFFKHTNSSNIFDIFQKAYGKKINILYSDISQLNFNENSFKNLKTKYIKKKIELCFLFNVNNKIKFLNQKTFKVYQGTHFNDFVQECDLILPSLTYFEKNSTYINNLGINQKTNQIINQNIPKDFLIFKMLSYTLNLKYTLDFYKKIYYLMPQLNYFINTNFNIKIQNRHNKFFKLQTQPLIKNYYLDNNITQNSKLMALRTKTLQNYFNNFQL